MTRLLIPFGFTFFILLSACSDEGPETKNDLSGQGGLPQSQRTQEDSPAGVKFNEQTQFKSLSDPDQP
jgi:hypothetical protein